MTSRTRTSTLVLLLLAGCQCGGPIARTAVVDAGAPVAVVPQVKAPVQVLEAIVLELSGGAQVLHPGAQDWVSLALGDPVRLGDAVRTSDDGEVSLGFGTATLRVQEGSRLELQMFEAHRLRAQLDGRAEATSGAGAMQLELVGPGGALATLDSGHAAFHNDGAEVTAAVLEGKLRLAADGKESELGAGELSELHSGQAWTAPKKLPRPVLRVAWPARLLTNKSDLPLQGRGGPMMRVLVQGHAVQLDDHGRFAAQVHLRRGKQRVQVVGVDPLGRTLTRAKVITMDPDAPTIRAQVHFR